MICYTIYGNNFCQNFQSKSPEISKHSRICYFDDYLAPNWLPARVKIPKNNISFEYIWFFVYFHFRLVPFLSSSVFCSSVFVMFRFRQVPLFPGFIFIVIILYSKLKCSFFINYLSTSDRQLMALTDKVEHPIFFWNIQN